MASLAIIDSFAVGQPALLTKFRAARIHVAWNILAEDDQVANHAARMAWAKKIFANYDADTSKEYLWTLSHAKIQSAGAAITDANLVDAVASFVDDWTA